MVLPVLSFLAGNETGRPSFEFSPIAITSSYYYHRGLYPSVFCSSCYYCAVYIIYNINSTYLRYFAPPLPVTFAGHCYGPNNAAVNNSIKILVTIDINIIVPAYGISTEKRSNTATSARMQTHSCALHNLIYPPQSNTTPCRSHKCRGAVQLLFTTIAQQKRIDTRSNLRNTQIYIFTQHPPLLSYLPEQLHRGLVRSVALVVSVLLPELHIELWLSRHSNL